MPGEGEMNKRKCAVCQVEKGDNAMLHQERLPFADRWDVCLACVDAMLDSELVVFDDGWVQPSLIPLKSPETGQG